MKKNKQGVQDLLDAIIDTIPPPNVDINDDVRMLIT
jgi:translation elongation factor EF-4